MKLNITSTGIGSDLLNISKPGVTEKSHGKPLRIPEIGDRLTCQTRIIDANKRLDRTLWKASAVRNNASAEYQP